MVNIRYIESDCLQKWFGPFIAFDISAFKESQCPVTDLCLQGAGTQLIVGALVTTGGGGVSHRPMYRAGSPVPEGSDGPHSRSVAFWISRGADVTLSALSLENTGNTVYKDNVKFMVRVTKSQQDEIKSDPSHIHSSDDTQCLRSSCDSHWRIQ